jgi:N-acetylglucosaminyldiphosphoundecaprenol N-acetyl-beta-D-mannosaminyltransferase
MSFDRDARIRLLGGEMDVVTPHEVMAAVDGWVAAGRTAIVANHNLHSLYLTRRSAAMRDFYQAADVIQVDSTPMIAWARLLRLPLGRRHRSTYLDWRELFWRLADNRGWRVYYLGGAPGVARKACQKLAKRYGSVAFAARDGYFGAAENAAVVEAINAFAPDIVFVGMGMPRQEEWIVANRQAIARGVLFSVGAAFDYEAGVQIAAPRWMGRMGLEWLFRLASQPRRLAFRYLIEPWSLAPAAIGDVFQAMARARRMSQPTPDATA